MSRVRWMRFCRMRAGAIEHQQTLLLPLKRRVNVRDLHPIAADTAIHERCDATNSLIERIDNRRRRDDKVLNVVQVAEIDERLGQPRAQLAENANQIRLKRVEYLCRIRPNLEDREQVISTHGHDD